MIFRGSVAALLALPLTTSAFYLPGASPNSYSPGAPVPLLVNSLGPSGAAGRNGGATDVVLYDAYDPRAGFCAPSSPSSVPLSLGSALFGDRLHCSLFSEINMGVNKSCQHLCTNTLSPSQSTFIHHLASSSYAHSWLVDALPAAQMVRTAKGDIFYEPGFPIGTVVTSNEGEKDGGVRLNNHFQLVLEYHPRPKEGVSRVVGVVVVPKSIDSLAGGGGPHCEGEQEPMVLDAAGYNEVAYTYDVIWRESSVSWATRWDLYVRPISSFPSTSPNEICVLPAPYPASFDPPSFPDQLDLHRRLPFVSFASTPRISC